MPSVDYKEVRRTVEVPKNTGVDGFLHVISEVLRRPRVQGLSIDAKGKVSYRVLVRPGDEVTDKNIDMDFEHLEPYHLIRNAEMKEYYIGGESASTVVTNMLDAVTAMDMTPIGFVLGVQSMFWMWYHLTTGTSLRDALEICGHPVHHDKRIPDTALVLCAGYGRTSSLVDVRVSLKAEMPTCKVLDTTVEVL